MDTIFSELLLQFDVSFVDVMSISFLFSRFSRKIFRLSQSENSGIF